MPTKHSIGRTVAVGVVIGLAGSAVLLRSDDSTIRRSLASTPNRPKNVRQMTMGAKAVSGARSLQYEQDLSSAGVITRQDTGAEVWLINQPKCGTGTLLTSLVASMDCEEYKPTKVADQSTQQIHTYGCNNDNALTVTHTPRKCRSIAGGNAGPKSGTESRRWQMCCSYQHTRSAQLYSILVVLDEQRKM